MLRVPVLAGIGHRYQLGVTIAKAYTELYNLGNHWRIPILFAGLAQFDVDGQDRMTFAPAWKPRGKVLSCPEHPCLLKTGGVSESQLHPRHWLSPVQS